MVALVEDDEEDNTAGQEPSHVLRYDQRRQIHTPQLEGMATATGVMDGDGTGSAVCLSSSSSSPSNILLSEQQHHFMMLQQQQLMMMQHLYSPTTGTINSASPPMATSATTVSAWGLPVPQAVDARPFPPLPYASLPSPAMSSATDAQNSSSWLPSSTSGFYSTTTPTQPSTTTTSTKKGQGHRFRCGLCDEWWEEGENSGSNASYPDRHNALIPKCPKCNKVRSRILPSPWIPFAYLDIHRIRYPMVACATS